MWVAGVSVRALAGLMQLTIIRIRIYDLDQSTSITLGLRFNHVRLHLQGRNRFCDPAGG
jgi:hypothetical protein